MPQFTDKWGKSEAKSRYGSIQQNGDSPSNKEQQPQFAEEKHGAKYDNDASGWVRGMGPKSPYPNFDGKR